MLVRPIVNVFGRLQNCSNASVHAERETAKALTSRLRASFNRAVTAPAQ